jgi:hypothetical protein
MGAIEDTCAGAKERKPFELRPHRVGDMGWVVYSEGLGYALQFGWDESLEELL